MSAASQVGDHSDRSAARQLPATYAIQRPASELPATPYGPPPNYPPPPNDPPPEPSAAMYTIPTTRRASVPAVLSLILGATWWFWLGSIAAVVLGHMARKECREQGYDGDMVAIFGLVLGYLGLFTLVVFVVIPAVAAAGG